MLPSLLAREIIQGLQSYITTGFETLTAHFSGAFRELVETPGRFCKGPYLSIDLPFLLGDSGSDFFHGLEPGFTPYRHQQQAWATVGFRSGCQVDSHRYRHRFGKNRVLSLSVARSLCPSSGAGDQGDHHLPHECSGHGSGQTFCADYSSIRRLKGACTGRAFRWWARR